MLTFACVGPEPIDALLPQTPVVFGFPLAEPERFPVLVGLDHDPIVQEDTIIGAATCTDYLGRSFPNCYDEHDGNDYILDGDFSQMDTDPAIILAAADGRVIDIEDGHYDKCHPDESFQITCDGHPISANYVKIEHIDGIVSRYWHMRKNSIRVAIGDTVQCGDIIGEVGSTGRSTGPHLHWGVMVFNTYVDPQLLLD